MSLATIRAASFIYKAWRGKPKAISFRKKNTVQI